MFIKLDKKIVEEKKAKSFDLSADGAVNEMKLLMDKERQGDVTILNQLTNNLEIKRITRIKGRALELEKIEADIKGQVFLESQIKALCIDYRLRFLRSTLFTGNVDVEVTAKIKQFCRQNDLDVNTVMGQGRFWIMAPVENFKLKTVIYETKASKRKADDPLLFYKLHQSVDNDDAYVLVHKWGADFTILRYLTGFKWKSWWHYHTVTAVTLMPAVAFLLGCAFSFNMIDNHPIWATLIVLLCSFTSAFIFSFKKQDKGSQVNKFFSPHNWNSDELLKNK